MASNKLYCDFCSKKVKPEMKAYKTPTSRVKTYDCPYCGKRLKTEIPIQNKK